MYKIIKKNAATYSFVFHEEAIYLLPPFYMHLWLLLVFRWDRGNCGYHASLLHN